MTIRVLKVGGSLFDLPDLADRLRDLLGRLSPARNVLIAGGGPLADVVRLAQPRHRFDDEAAHWLCITTLTATAAWLHALLPEASLTEEPSAILTARSPSLWILQVERLLKRAPAGSAIQTLPRDWSVTTDSIAATVATEIEAAELLLVKSIDFPVAPNLSREQQLAQAADLGAVDRYFPLAAASVPRLSWVNLRCGGSTKIDSW